MYGEEDVVVVDKILDLLYIRDKNCIQFSEKEVNSMFTFSDIT